MYSTCYLPTTPIIPQEDHIKQLQTKISNIELQNKFEADQSAVQAAQMEMLNTLRTIRAAMVASPNNSNSGDSSKELQALKEENATLTKMNTKQRYRIDHLVNNMEEMQKKLEA